MSAVVPMSQDIPPALCVAKPAVNTSTLVAAMDDDVASTPFDEDETDIEKPQLRKPQLKVPLPPPPPPSTVFVSLFHINDLTPSRIACYRASQWAPESGSAKKKMRHRPAMLSISTQRRSHRTRFRPSSL